MYIYVCVYTLYMYIKWLRIYSFYTWVVLSKASHTVGRVKNTQQHRPELYPELPFLQTPLCKIYKLIETDGSNTSKNCWDRGNKGQKKLT